MSHKIIITVALEDIRKIWPTMSTKQGSHGHTENDAVNMGCAWVFSRFSAYLLWMLV